MKKRLLMTSRIPWALFGCALALATGGGAATLLAEEGPSVKSKATPVFGSYGEMLRIHCEGVCTSNAVCCIKRDDEEQSPDGTIAN
ncbi:MAG: hypothetical protein ABW277_23055 [Longimicrobiaceae bacterium]